MINTNELNDIARERGDALISIYIPTHRKGAEIEQDAIRLKNQIAQLEKRCEEQTIDLSRVEPVIKRLRQLVTDKEFWRFQGEGLGVLADQEDFRLYRLSSAVDEVAHIGERFCLRPLLPAVADEARFYVLVLSQNAVKLLSCTRETVSEVDQHDIPTSIADALGYDWEQRSLQFHTGDRAVGAAGSARAAVFHGQGRGTTEEKDEVHEFLKRVDDGVRRLLRGQTAPVVVAAVEYEIAMFNEVSKLPNVMKKGVAGNPEHRSIEEIHADALPIVEPTLNERARRKRAALKEAAHSDHVVSGIGPVLDALDASRVGSLFVDTTKPVWGATSGGGNGPALHDKREPGDEDLVDLIVSRALATGAEIICADRSDIPEGAPVAALTRF